MKTILTKRHAPLLALCLALLAQEAAAQDEMTPQRIAEALKRTDEVLMDTAHFVRETESAKARFVLENAMQIQAKARETFQAGLDPLNSMRLALSLKLTIEAREQAMRARIIAKEDLDREQRTRQAIERAKTLLERAAARTREISLEPVREGRVRHLLEEARKQIHASVSQMREHQYKVAYKLALSAQGLCEQAIKLMRDDRSSPEDVRRQVERTQRLLEESTEALTGSLSPRSAGLLDKAKDLQERARDRLLDTQYRAALRLTLEARKFIHRALRMSENRGSPDRVRRNLGQTDRLIESTKEKIRECGSPEAQSLFEQGQRLQNQAQELFRAESYDASLERTLEARTMIRHAVERALEGSRSVSRAEAEHALTLTQDLLEQARPRVSASGNTEAEHILERAATRLSQARDRFADGNYGEALARTQLARRLVLRAVKAVDSGGDQL